VPGAHRLATSEVQGLPNGAFRNPDGGLVWVACNNNTGAERRVAVHTRGRQPIALTIPSGAAVTVVL